VTDQADLRNDGRAIKEDSNDLDELERECDAILGKLRSMRRA